MSLFRLLTVLAISTAGFACAAPAPAQDTFQVNTYTTGGQDFPQILVKDDGDFVIVWNSGDGPVDGADGHFGSVQGRRFEASGEAIGGEFTVNQGTGGDQMLGSAAMTGDGRLVVHYQHNPDPLQFLEPFTFYFRFFDADGSPLGDELESPPGLGTLGRGESGRFVRLLESGTVRRFEEDGTAVGDEIDLGIDGAANDLAVADDGEFVVVWTEGTNPGDTPVMARRLDSNGLDIGTNFQVNSTTIGYARDPVVEYLEGGSFVVAWERAPGGGRQVLGQVFHSDGSFAGEEFQIHTDNSDYQRDPDIAADPGTGGFYVVWERSLEEGFGPDKDPYLLGRRFDAAGEAVAAEFQVSVDTEENSRLFRLWDATAGPDGSLLTVWQLQFPENRLMARRIGPDIFEDGFETGDTSRWSNTAGDDPF